MNDQRTFNYLSLFTGGGGLDLGFHQAVRRARCVAAVEVESFARQVLVSRMEEGLLDPCPVYSDVASFDGRKFRGLVDGVIGGSPCQDMSLAGARRGLGGSKSVLFYEMARIIEESEPEWVLWENVLGAKKWLPAIFAEFERIGYAGKGTVVRASDVGAPHQRARIFVLARRVADAQRGERDGRTDEPGRRAEGRTPAGGPGEGMADSESLRLRRRPSDAVGGAASDSGAPVRGGDVAHGAGARLGDAEDSGADRGDARAHGSGGFESKRAGLDLAHAERARWFGDGSGGPSEAGGGGPLGEVEGPGFGLADAESLGRIERGAESDAEGEARSDDAGTVLRISCQCGTEFVGLLSSLCPGCGEIRGMYTNELADSERAALRLQPGWGSWADGTGAPLAGLAGEDMANSDGRGFEAVGETFDSDGSDAPGDDDDGRGPELADSGDARLQGREWARASGEGAGASRPAAQRSRPEWPPGPDGDWSRIDPRYFPAQSRLRRVANGLAGGMDPALASQDVWADRLRMLGNGVVPKQAAAAIRFLYAAITRSTIPGV